VIAAVREVCDKIPLQTFQKAIDDGQYRLRRCIQLGGEYLLYLKKKFKKYLIFGNFALAARTSGPPYSMLKIGEIGKKSSTKHHKTKALEGRSARSADSPDGLKNTLNGRASRRYITVSVCQRVQ
jgi:hypothetical protein